MLLTYMFVRIEAWSRPHGFLEGAKASILRTCDIQYEACGTLCGLSSYLNT